MTWKNPFILSVGMLIALALGGCFSGLPKYREFTRSIDFDRLETYRIEGPLLPGGFENRIRVTAYQDAVIAGIHDAMQARGFVPAEGLADADMVMEWYWVHSEPPTGQPTVSRPAEGPVGQAYLRLGVRIFETRSGEIFWRNAASHGLTEAFLNAFSAVEMARQTLRPFPDRAESGVAR